MRKIEQRFGVDGAAGNAVFQRLPSRNSMTMKTWPSSSSISWMVQMLGWFSAEAARASR